MALTLLLAPLGVAATGDALREGMRNGTTRSETEIIGKFNATTAAKGGYVTRQSNTQTGPRAGGAAIYGCRGAAGGTATGSAPCLRASNLANGFAFELASKNGPAGLFEVGSASAPPFVTNGAGLVTNLNADKVDGLDAAQLRGTQGPPGPTGSKGDTGTVDTSKFYDKTASDARFLAIGATAANADKLDGIDSTGFVAAGSAGAGTQSSRINSLPSVTPGNDERFGAISGISTATADLNAVTMISPPVPTVARDLLVRYTTGVSGGNRVVSLVVNGTDSALSCMAAPAGAPAETCSDTQSNVSIPAGSILALKVRTSALNPFTVPATDALVTWRTTVP